MTKAEHEKREGVILKHLFDVAKSETTETLGKLIDASKSEAQYYIEALKKEGLIEAVGESMGTVHWTEWQISAAGRKKIMEG